MRSRNSVEEKLEVVISLTEKLPRAEICRMHGIYQTESAKWEEQSTEGGNKDLSVWNEPPPPGK